MTSTFNGNDTAHETKRLVITSYHGATHLFLQFNFSDQESKNKDVYRTLRLLMDHTLCSKYRAEGLEKFGREDFYKVRHTDNFGGFCLSIQWESVETKEEGLAIVGELLDFVLEFQPEAWNYTNEKTETMVKNSMDEVKRVAECIREDIYIQHSLTFQKRYVDPFD